MEKINLLEKLRYKYSFYKERFIYNHIIKPTFDFIFNFSYKCNRACPYCKIKGLIKQYPYDMSISMFNKTLNWLEKNDLNHFRVEGGEPMIYPYFKEVLKVTREKCFVIEKLFTNLISPKVRDLISLIDQDNVNKVYLHYMLPKQYTSSEHENFLKNMNLLKGNNIPMILRHVVETKDTPYKHIFDIARRFDIKKIRGGMANPGFCGDNRFTSIQQLKDMMPNIINFIETGLSQGFDVEFVHPLPICFIPENKRKYFKKNILKSTCFSKSFVAQDKNIVRLYSTSINPDLSVYYCDGLSIKSRKKIIEYETPKQIFEEFKDVIAAIRWTPTFKACMACDYYKAKLCHGTCLAFKIDKNLYRKQYNPLRIC